MLNQIAVLKANNRVVTVFDMNNYSTITRLENDLKKYLRKQKDKDELRLEYVYSDKKNITELAINIY